MLARLPVVGALFALFICSTPAAFAQPLPSGWSTSDIGPVGAVGSAAGAGGAFTVDGAGADVWGTADAFRLAYTTMTGDGSIVTQVVTEQNVDVWTKAGVMMRDSLAASSRHAFMLVSPGKGLAFQRRVTAGGLSVHTSGGSGTAPYFVKLTRAGSTFTAYKSLDGQSWALVGSDTIAMGATIYVGLAVTSHQSAILARATFASTVVTSSGTPPDDGGGDTAPLPAGWLSTDIGLVGAAGTAAGSAGSFTVDAAGADIWDSTDAFRFTYTALTGDGSIVSQVTTIENVHAWTKAGVMLRETLAPGSRHASMFVSPGKGLAFQRRRVTNGSSVHTSGGTGTAPRFVKLTRAGTSVTAFTSADGVSWTQVGNETIAMGSTIYAGIAVSSHVSGVLATATFGSTAITPAEPEPPVVPLSTLRVLTWNTHHGGVGTDGRYDPDRFMTWVARFAPDIVALQEVEAGQEAGLASLLQAKTGTPWVYQYKSGNMVLSKLQLGGQSECLVNATANRYASHLGVLVNGRPVNVWSVHFGLESSGTRLAETQALQQCEQTWTETRIAVGDYNMQADTPEYNSMTAGHVDAWRQATALGAAVNYAGNCDGCTRNSRIDYVFTSKGAAGLSLRSAEIFDTRDGNGVMPSDHKPLLAVYSVN